MHLSHRSSERRKSGEEECRATNFGGLKKIPLKQWWRSGHQIVCVYMKKKKTLKYFL